ncbi:MAG TPA: peptidoglycan DD-metalloendopeptidase family protein [Egibacteraceae bacterium]|nr:peptidoglycan DD-metalloendopeptidase family protein [Egibacteraceae bacterium]
MRHVVAALALVAVAVVPWPAAAQASPDRVGGLAAAHGYAVPPVPGRVVRHFDPPATRYAAGHRGVDLRAHAGDPVVAAMGGTVTFAGRVAGIGWVTVNHGGGLDTTYGPLDPPAVSAGDVVPAGWLLGFLARDATHLDWGARLAGEYVDPLALLGRWETYLTLAVDDHPPLGGLAAQRGSGPAAGGWTWPAAGPVTSGFGPRVHPVTGRRRLHAGIDIGAPAGAPARAAAAGTVTFAGAVSGYGTTVVVDHGGGVTTLYGHLSGLATAAGARVTAGSVVGRVGSTGLSTGPHLHFEVRRAGTPLDPATWLRGAGG